MEPPPYGWPPLGVCLRPWGRRARRRTRGGQFPPLVFDLGADTQFGTYTGLAAVPVQAAAVVGPSVAGLLVEATGSPRALFGVAAVALGIAWLLLQRVRVETATR